MSTDTIPALAIDTTVTVTLDRVKQLAFVGLGLSALLGVVAAVVGFVVDVELDQLVYFRAIGSIIASGIFLFLVAKTQAGKRWAFTRLRIIAAIAPVSLLAVALLPGPYPIWVRVEQVIHAAVIVAIAVNMFKPALKAAFPKKA